MEKLCNLCGWCVVLTLLVGATAWAQTTYPVPQIANPLVPTAVVPGSPAFTLTVNGTGFVSGSTVYWNGSPRATTYVSAAQLTATINASDVATATSGSVTVHSPSGIISNALYLLATNSVPLPSFGAAEINNVGTDSLSADLNGDGSPDVLVNLTDSILVALGNGDGSLQPPTQYYPSGTVNGGNGTTLADFNNDGFPDVAFPSYRPNGMQIMLNSGAGTFASAPTLNLSGDTFLQSSTAVADVNGDGKLDLIFTADVSVGVALGNGDGTFQTPTYIPLPQSSYTVVVGDFNRDGIPDIAASLYDSNDVAILIGNGDGTFQPAATYSAGDQALTLSAADVNGDGFPDIIAVDGNGESFDVLLNAGNGTFLPPVNYAATGYLGFDGLALGDLNGDGKLDVVLQNTEYCSNNCIFIFPGNGDGTFQAGTAYGIRQDREGPGEGEISLADFNHDGRLDIATPSANGPYLMIQTTGPAPTLVPGVLSFASQAVGSQSQPQSTELFQPGNTEISVYSATVTGDFVLWENGCENYVLGPGNSETCGILVTFQPTTTGVRSGTLSVTSSGGTQNLALVGTATAAINVSVSPSSIGFGTELLGSTSQYRTVTIANIGSQSVSFTSIVTAGADPSDFVVNDLCGGTLGVGASCNVQVSFRPTRPHVRTATLNISDNAAASPQSVSLSGTGTALYVSTDLLNFGDVGVGSSSSQPVEVRNVGAMPIAISRVMISGPDPGDYSQANNCGSSIPAGASCKYTVTFTPEYQGSFGAALEFTNNGSGTNSIAAVTLRGHGY